MLTHDEVMRIADTVLARTLGPIGFQAVTVGDGVDADGEDALFLVARFARGARSVDGKAGAAALSGLRAALQAKGEDRFPLLRLEFPDDEIPYATNEDFRA